MKITQKEFKEALGIETKFISEEEMKYRKVFRKGLYFSRDVKKGEMIHQDMIIALRPRMDGAEPSENYEKFLRKFTERDFKKYDIIKL